MPSISDHSFFLGVYHNWLSIQGVLVSCDALADGAMG